MPFAPLSPTNKPQTDADNYPADCGRIVNVMPSPAGTLVPPAKGVYGEARQNDGGQAIPLYPTLQRNAFAKRTRLLFGQSRPNKKSVYVSGYYASPFRRHKVVHDRFVQGNKRDAELKL